MEFGWHSGIHPSYHGFMLGRDWYAFLGTETRRLDRYWYEFITKMLRTLPQLECVDAQQVLTTAYEMEYHIYPHLRYAKERPLSSVAFFECENINDGSLLEQVIKTYTGKNIREHYGLTLLEYLDLPVDVVDLLNRTSDELNKSKASIADDLTRQLQALDPKKNTPQL